MKELAITAVVLATLVGCSDGSSGRIGPEIVPESVAENESTVPNESTEAPPVSTDTGNTDSGNTDTGNSDSGGGISSLVANHRDGQTFLYWNEAGTAQYHVYRHNAPITSANLAAATRLTERWGPLDQNTSVNRHADPVAPANYVINNLAQPLRDDQGLFVHTTQDGQQGDAYYAVTTVDGGVENTNIVSGRNALSNAVRESVSTPKPVLTLSKGGGKGRIYTQYMDYAKWNPTFNGYGYNFGIALPRDYNASNAYPLMVEPHAFDSRLKYIDATEYDWPVIQLFPHDPGESVGVPNTWWYGYAADHNYKTQGSTPRSGRVENFTEQRVIAAMNFLLDSPDFNIDRDLVYMFGHSMGGSGALTLGLRYPSLFAGIYASQPMTNYKSSPTFQYNFVTLWGEQSDNLPIVNNGANTEEIKKYDINGSQPTKVWDWMNHQEQLVRRRADRFPYLMVDHGKQDTTIDWQTQGRPMAKALTDARVGFSASALGGYGHTWLAFDPVVTSMFGLGFGDESAWQYRKSLSFPGIQYASGSGSLQPGDSGDDRQNTTIEWSTPNNNFDQGIVDMANRYEITIRSMTVNQTADITPRSTNSFKPSSGRQCIWNARDNNNGATVGSGSATVDSSQLLTVTQVPIVTNSGTRLVINCP